MKQLDASFGESCKTTNRPVIFSFFGPPGSGKGTLAQALVQKKQYQMLSTGNLCRWHVAQETEFGKLLDGYLKRGHLIPDALVTDMVIDWLKTYSKPGNGPVILDGFPRTEGQAELLLNYFRSQGNEAAPFRVILFKAPNAVIIERITSRVVCSNKACQATLSIKENLTSCKHCGGVLVQRDDDKEEVVRERLSHYPGYRDTLLSFYQKIGQVVEEFDVDSLPSGAVYDRFCDLAEKKVA